MIPTPAQISNCNCPCPAPLILSPSKDQRELVEASPSSIASRRARSRVCSRLFRGPGDPYPNYPQLVNPGHPRVLERLSVRLARLHASRHHLLVPRSRPANGAACVPASEFVGNAKSRLGTSVNSIHPYSSLTQDSVIVLESATSINVALISAGVFPASSAAAM